MKFTLVAALTMATMASAFEFADIGKGIDEGLGKAGDGIEGAWDDVEKNADEAKDNIEKEFKEATAGADAFYASVTADIESQRAKVTEFISTATHSGAAAEASTMLQALDKYEENVKEAKKEFDEGAGARPTAAIAMGALLGGAAIIVAAL